MCSKLCRYYPVCMRGDPVGDECPVMINAKSLVWKPTTQEVKASIAGYIPCKPLEVIVEEVRREKHTA